MDAAEIYLAEVKALMLQPYSRQSRPIAILDYGAVSARDLAFLYSRLGQQAVTVPGANSGRAFQDPTSVLSHSKYAYSTDNPTIALDPDGDSIGLVHDSPSSVAAYAGALAVALWQREQGTTSRCITQLGAPRGFITVVKQLGQECAERDGSYESISQNIDSRDAWISDDNGNIGLRFTPPQRDGLLAGICFGTVLTGPGFNDWSACLDAVSRGGYFRQTLRGTPLSRIEDTLRSLLPSWIKDDRHERSAIFSSPSRNEWLLVRPSETERAIRIRGEINEETTTVLETAWQPFLETQGWDIPFHGLRATLRKR